MHPELSKSNWRLVPDFTFLVLSVGMLGLTGLEAFLPLAINQGQRMSWITVIFACLVGWLGLLLTPKAGFPALWSTEITARKRFIEPFILGTGLGLVMFVIDLLHPLGSEAQTIFPDSLIVFSLAGLVEEIIVHLFLTTLLIWLISGLLLKNRHQVRVFWIVAIGIGILYWLLQISAVLNFFPEKFSLVLALQILLVVVTTITLGAYSFRKGGFLAALSLRYGFYLI
jgi:hypothetical protein